MKNIILLITIIAVSVAGRGTAKTSNTGESSMPTNRPNRSISIQPGVGMRPNFGKDLLITNLVTTDLGKYIVVAAHTSASLNRPFKRTFNHIRTNYDHTLSQTFGIGTTLSGGRVKHSLMLMAGLKYYNFKQTLENPELDKMTTTVSSIDPDMGIRYNFTYGTKKCFFHAGLYLPLFPYPVKTANIEAIEGNLNSVSLEMGIGIRL